MEELNLLDFEQLPMEDRIGIELLVGTCVNDDIYRNYTTKEDKKYLMTFNQKAKDSAVHKQYLDFVLGVILEDEPDIQVSRNRFYINISELESELLIQ
jgi:hypothetical protein